ncbi:hypothetical protein SUGI_0770820 [Cryptomeria japonica]|uniref:uncharacterized protein LOC131856253 n=1 Tax=Cryptomeria japonica TaxID=3369 RepID=UPI00241494BB|nr:uncharacterized protein LOC131856253 [Cryptomeria japonica]GLJ37886.1 hypothetical protein SUGI_0770820 [Cryptomeria japonica]
MEWQRQVRECMRGVRFDKAKKPKFNESQSDNLCRAFLAKLSKFCEFGWPPISGAGGKIKRVSLGREDPLAGEREEYKESAKIILQRAWKEVYRVIREAEMYLQYCSGPEWWKKALTLGAAGEAHVVHMHDLLWCVFCLDLSLVYAADSKEAYYDEVCCRRMGEFGGEMNSPLRIHDEYVDKKQLVSTLNGLWKEYESKNALAKIMLNNEEENKARLAKYLAQRLQAWSNLHEAARVTELTVPEWLRIDPRDLKWKNQTQNVVGMDCDEICEASWLGIKVGVKEISSEGYERFQKKALDLTRLQSPFLVQFFGACLDGDRYYLITEMVSSNLVKLLEEKPSILLDACLDIMLQISRGMEYLHSQRIMHLDLRPSNVLIEPSCIKDFREEGHGRVKILNMGMAVSRLNKTKSLLSEFLPSTCYSYWMAPEAHGENLKECTYKADVYSFGMICYQILTGKQPFEDDIPDDKLYASIRQGQRPVFPSSLCPSLLADYIYKWWDSNPGNRPHFYEISKFLRYMKLLVLRIPSPQKPNSVWISCRQFDREQITKFFEGISADERVTSEEEGLIIRALDGDFPESFRTRDVYDATKFDVPVASRRSFSGRFLLRPQGSDIKSLVSLPAYIKKYSYEELHKATCGFELRLASFVCSVSIWKAILPDRSHVAVKLYDKGNSESFRNETTVLSQVHHPNIIRLRGVCVGNSKFLMVYDYMAMGSLDKRLFSTPAGKSGHQSHVLNWVMRRRIALGLARGLAYLHQDCSNKFLNVRIDTNTILLDERFSAKLCGFGLAKPAGYLGPGTQLNSTIQWQKKTEQEDEEVANIYSFGVVLLEILTGCRCIDTPYSEYYSLHESVHGIGSRTVMEFVDHRVRNEIEVKEAKNVINLGLWCIVKDPSLRPTMNRAVLVMEGLMDLCAPPLGKVEILPPPLRSHHFLQSQRANHINNNPANSVLQLPMESLLSTMTEIRRIGE